LKRDVSMTACSAMICLASYIALPLPSALSRRLEQQVPAGIGLVPAADRQRPTAQRTASPSRRSATPRYWPSSALAPGLGASAPFGPVTIVAAAPWRLRNSLVVHRRGRASRPARASAPALGLRRQHRRRARARHCRRDRRGDWNCCLLPIYRLPARRCGRCGADAPPPEKYPLPKLTLPRRVRGALLGVHVVGRAAALLEPSTRYCSASWTWLKSFLCGLVLPAPAAVAEA
jgi:hypothetical protein